MSYINVASVLKYIQTTTAVTLLNRCVLQPLPWVLHSKGTHVFLVVLFVLLKCHSSSQCLCTLYFCDCNSRWFDDDWWIVLLNQARPAVVQVVRCLAQTTGKPPNQAPSKPPPSPPSKGLVINFVIILLSDWTMLFPRRSGQPFRNWLFPRRSRDQVN